jgi:hypothetical protein
MITFFPRDIERWRSTDLFDFTRRPDISLSMSPKTDSVTFYNRAELIQFLKEHGVRLDDAKHPLEFTGPNNHSTFGPGIYNVTQWTLLGWMKEDYR